MKKIVLLYLGGSEAAMDKRMDVLERKWEEIRPNLEKGDMMRRILAGYACEIICMRNLKNLTKESAPGALSYDTVSNIRRRLNELEKADIIYISTGAYHWKSIINIIIPKKFPELSEKIVWLDSKEKEGFVGRLRYQIYRCLGPTIMERLAIITRPMKYFFQYICFLMRDAFCIAIGVGPIDSIE